MADDNFDVSGMEHALEDVTNKNHTRSAQPAVRTDEMEANSAKARQLGWVEPLPFNYEGLTAIRGRSIEDLSLWGHGAAKYEWNDEYGDVGPPVPALEAELFGSEFRNRQGHKLSK